MARVTGDWQSTVIPPRSGRAWRLDAGQLLRIVDVEGSQSGDLFAVAADDLQDGQSNGRTFDMGGTIRLSTGSVLYSRRSRPLLRIVEDEVGEHDMLYAPCSQEMFELQHGVTTPHPNCFDNLANPLAAYGVPAATVTIAFNFFMNVVVGPDGRLEILPPVSKAGQSMTFAADVIVAVTSCSAPGANAGGARPLRVDLSAGPPGLRDLTVGRL
jgi:uncharacterized protein YcgI (DUF1989 family)